MSDLAEEGCVPCRSGAVPIAGDEQARLQRTLPHWQVTSVDGVPRLVREFKFGNFTAAMRFAVAVGKQADEQDHHPELLIAFGRVRAAWWTHAIGGLHRNDFVMAAKTDALFAQETA